MGAAADTWAGVEEYLEYLGETGWRGLLVLHTSKYYEALQGLLETLSRRGECLLVALSDYRRKLAGTTNATGACELRGPPDLGRILGREYSSAVIAIPGLLRPNIVAGVGETVRAGGVLALLLPPLATWSPGPPGGTGLYREYLVNSIPLARAVYWADMDRNRVILSQVPREKPRKASKTLPPTRHGVPRALRSLVATPSQAKGLEAFASLLRGKKRSLLVHGNRGRGKSFLLGLGLALAVHWHAIGRAEVVVPSLEQGESIVAGLLRGLEALGHRYKTVESNGLVLRVTGPWYRVRFSTPETGEPASLLVVDEAASVGVARTRRLSWRSGRTVAATTIHGYEGSGRAVAFLLKNQLPKPMGEVVLEEPIRYYPGDPLEEWLYNVFLLDLEPPGEAAGREPVGETRCRRVDKRELLARSLLRRVAGVLVLAHYRNEPDDILLLLEAPNHSLYAVEEGSLGVIAVADVAWEEPSRPKEERLGLTLLSVHGGPEALGTRAARIVRIAVLPPLQGRGIGSLLLGCVEREAGEKGAEIVVAVFSRHEVVGFWAKNGYKAVYISPRYNRVTGEKNLVYAKPLTPRAAGIVGRASSALRLRLLLSSQSIYRDLAAEKTPLILSTTMKPSDCPPLGLTGEQQNRLHLFLEGSIDYEQASDPVFLETVKCLSCHDTGELGLSWEESVALIARIVQGKPLNEVAGILGVKLDEAWRLSVEAARKMLRNCLGYRT